MSADELRRLLESSAAGRTPDDVPNSPQLVRIYGVVAREMVRQIDEHNADPSAHQSRRDPPPPDQGPTDEHLELPIGGPGEPPYRFLLSVARAAENGMRRALAEHERTHHGN